MTILPGYEPEDTRTTRDAGACLGRMTYGYETVLGVRISRDPLGEFGGLNLYGYVRNSPVNAIDPNGQFAI